MTIKKPNTIQHNFDMNTVALTALRSFLPRQLGLIQCQRKSIHSKGDKAFF